VRGVRGAAARHPLLVDVALALVLAGVLVPVAVELGAVSGAGWVWLGALHLAVVGRRRAPVLVFWVCAVLSFAAVTLGVQAPSLLVVPMVAVHAVARHRDPRHLRPIAAAAVPLAVGWLAHEGPWWDLVALLALFGVAALLGTTARTRHAQLALLADRARQREREREQRARLTVADERARIAREVHDIVAHNVSVMVALSDGARACVPDAPEQAAELMAKASVTGREALTEIRRLVGVLRDGPAGPAAPQPGFDDIDGLAEQVRSAGLPVVLTRSGAPGPWGQGAGLAAYRIVQEALTNTMKHAGPPARAEVRLRFDDAAVEIEVLDDGDPAPGPVTAGHGLTGMAERAAPYDGSVRAGPRPDRGWRVHARLRFGGAPE
jgi:signal transduction histidine kinase